MNSEEREIDLLDLIEVILKRWRLYIVWMLIGLLIGGVVSFAMALHNKSTANAETRTKKLNSAVLLAEEELDNEENSEELKENAEKNLLSYQEKEKLYDMQEEYMEKSIYNNLDGNSVHSASLSYYIDNHFGTEYPLTESYNNISDIMNYITGQITSDMVCKKIIASVYPDSENKYIKELIGASSDGSILYVSVIGGSENDVKTVTNILKTEIDRIYSEAVEIYGEMDLTLQSEQYIVESSKGVTEAQANNVQTLVNYYTEMDKILKSMSGAQLDYFKAKLSAHKFERSAVVKDLPLYKYISKKIIALVALVFIFLAVAVVACGYLFSGSVKTKEDVRLSSDAIYLGSVEKADNSKKNWIDNIIYNLFHGHQADMALEARIELVANIVIEAMKKEELNTLCIAGSSKCQDDEAIKSLKDKIEAAGFSVSIADDILRNVEGAKLLNAADITLICEKLNVSRYNEIEQERVLCEMYKVNVLGCITC